METRAHHVLIGFFVLMMLTGLVSMMIWVAKVDIDREYDFYTIYFGGPVTGLSRSGDVRFNGIYVGTVQGIQLDEKDPSRVKVTIRVFMGTPITKRSVATLEVLGLTGVSFVQISSDIPQSEAEEGAPSIPKGEDYPVIASRVGGIQSLVTTAPELLNRGIMLLGRLSQVVRDENIVKVDNILSNIETVTGGVAAETAELQEAIRHMNSALARIDNISGSVGEMVDTDVRDLITDLREAAGRFNSLSANLDSTVSENRTAITTFTSTALPEFAQFAADARRVAASLARIAERIEEDPASFLFSDKAPEVQAP